MFNPCPLCSNRPAIAFFLPFRTSLPSFLLSRIPAAMIVSDNLPLHRFSLHNTQTQHNQTMTSRQQTPEQLAMIAAAEGRNAFANLRESYADLLSALQSLLHSAESLHAACDYSEPKSFEIARAAIAKAKGEA